MCRKPEASTTHANNGTNQAARVRHFSPFLSALFFFSAGSVDPLPLCFSALNMAFLRRVRLACITSGSQNSLPLEIARCWMREGQDVELSCPFPLLCFGGPLKKKKESCHTHTQTYISICRCTDRFVSRFRMTNLQQSPKTTKF